MRTDVGDLRLGHCQHLVLLLHKLHRGRHTALDHTNHYLCHSKQYLSIAQDRVIVILPINKLHRLRWRRGSLPSLIHSPYRRQRIALKVEDS